MKRDEGISSPALGTRCWQSLDCSTFSRFSCCNAMQIANKDVLVISIPFHIQ